MNKKISINLIAIFVILGVDALTGLFLSPFLVEKLGVEAQGFIGLSRNFVSYASIALLALNSMSGRFISVEYHKGNLEKAQKYYTSVFIANIFLLIMLIVPLIFLVFYLDRIINIPEHLKLEVQILFSLSFLNLFLGNIFSQWNNVFFIKDKLYIGNIGEAIKSILNAAALFLLYRFLFPHVWYTAAIGSLLIIFTSFWGFWYKRKLLPELRVDRKLFSLSYIKKILASGIWRTIQSTGELLLTGLDLLICNLLISPESMGILSLAKTVPNIMQQLNWRIASIFSPKLTIQIAKNEKAEILTEMRKSCKINALIGTIPIAGLIVFGKEFFSLWVPSQDAELLQALSVLVCFGMAFVSGIQPIGNLFLAVNKVRPQAISVIISGVLNIILMFFILKFTNLGIYAVAGISSVISLLRNIFYTVPAAAKYLGFKWYTFFYGFKYSIIGTITVGLIAAIIKTIISPNSWLLLILAALITAAVSLVSNYLLIYKRKEKSWKK